MTVRDHPKAKQAIKTIAIVGAGIIGLTCAWALARRGAAVTIYDASEPGRGASWAAAGMLAPAFEANGGSGHHPSLSRLCRDGAMLWPAFARQLEEQSGRAIGYMPGPSLAVALDEAMATALDVLASRLEAADMPVTRLGGAAARAVDPALSEQVSSALALPTDGAVDNRSVIAALLELCACREDVSMRWNTPVAHPTRLLSDHDAVLVTAGWNSPSLLRALEAVKPVGGQLLSVARRADMPATTIRSGDLYITPKADRIVIGASVEPGAVRSGPDDRTIAKLRAAAEAICPSLRDGVELERWAGTRPGTPDHAPILAQMGADPIFVATGHHRNGILLAPLTSQLMADWILEGRKDPRLEALAPGRFAQDPV